VVVARNMTSTTSGTDNNDGSRSEPGPVRVAVHTFRAKLADAPAKTQRAVRSLFLLRRAFPDLGIDVAELPFTDSQSQED
jgi:hypothetical protein